MQLDVAAAKMIMPRMQNSGSIRHGWDVFISHAGEDKVTVARPLAQSLRSLGLRVWLDETELRIGDNLRRKIDEGLAHSRFGIIILSPAFFRKEWPQYELDGLITNQNSGGRRVLLPIWHGITENEVRMRSPSLAGAVALNTNSRSINYIAAEIARVVGSFQR